jgi:DNA replication protein
LKITDAEAMLLIHLIAFKDKLGCEFPTPEELSALMSSSLSAVSKMLQKLMKEQVITIDEFSDPITGVLFERYNLSPLYEKLAQLQMEEYLKKLKDQELAALKDKQNETEIQRKQQLVSQGYNNIQGNNNQGNNNQGNRSQGNNNQGNNNQGNNNQGNNNSMLEHHKMGLLAKSIKPAASGSREANIFTIFEQEFGRPITPMECENITQWLDKDQLSQELIMAALKEAVFAGKIHFRYIDRILLDWSRNRVTTVEQAKIYTQNYRSR